MAKKPPKKAATDGAQKKKSAATADADEQPAPAPQPTPASAGGAAAVTAMPIGINAQYTKDLSFEAPGAPGIFAALQETAPDIAININVNANPLQEKTYEVALEIHAECKVKEQMAFIIELQYAGLFTLNIPDEHLQAVLLVECPRLLFPFARNILADVSRDGGFPPIMLGPVDFAGMYQSKLDELQQAQQAGGAGGGADGGAGAPA